MSILAELDKVRQDAKRRMPYGEPAIALNPHHVLVSSKDPMVLHMRLDHLIDLIGKALDQVGEQPGR